jgi:hypothetical protein
MRSFGILEKLEMTSTPRCFVRVYLTSLPVHVLEVGEGKENFCGVVRMTWRSPSLMAGLWESESPTGDTSNMYKMEVRRYN